MDDVGGVVGVLMHAGGVGRASFFIIDLSGGEVCFEVTPCFVRIWFVVPFFNCVCKDACIAEDDFADADKLWVGFWGAMSFRQCCIFMYLAEDVCDWLFMNVLMLQ